ncbi:VWA domain-containing protein [Periweissella cryptocerci]|uniref:VWA domain-containing protein n=1 Tax=Periweissella cryptocerci TaxID=2506420 RepID=A0A4P6YUF2_9LACO|nr:VWA domain-containing protein [Periweissella cryptocerci]QBO36346.1 VWA domain-containing protein [Periweissella cryptocerci]
MSKLILIILFLLIGIGHPLTSYAYVKESNVPKLLGTDIGEWDTVTPDSDQYITDATEVYPVNYIQGDTVENDTYRNFNGKLGYGNNGDAFSLKKELIPRATPNEYEVNLTAAGNDFKGNRKVNIIVLLDRSTSMKDFELTHETVNGINKLAMVEQISTDVVNKVQELSELSEHTEVEDLNVGFINFGTQMVSSGIREYTPKRGPELVKWLHAEFEKYANDNQTQYTNMQRAIADAKREFTEWRDANPEADAEYHIILASDGEPTMSYAVTQAIDATKYNYADMILGAEGMRGQRYIQAKELYEKAAELNIPEKDIDQDLGIRVEEAIDGTFGVDADKLAQQSSIGLNTGRASELFGITNNYFDELGFEDDVAAYVVKTEDNTDQIVFSHAYPTISEVNLDKAKLGIYYHALPIGVRQNFKNIGIHNDKKAFATLANIDSDDRLLPVELSQTFVTQTLLERITEVTNTVYEGKLTEEIPSWLELTSEPKLEAYEKGKLSKYSDYLTSDLHVTVKTKADNSKELTVENINLLKGQEIKLSYNAKVKPFTMALTAKSTKEKQQISEYGFRQLGRATLTPRKDTDIADFGLPSVRYVPQPEAPSLIKPEDDINSVGEADSTSYASYIHEGISKPKKGNAKKANAKKAVAKRGITQVNSTLTKQDNQASTQAIADQSASEIHEVKALAPLSQSVVTSLDDLIKETNPPLLPNQKGDSRIKNKAILLISAGVVLIGIFVLVRKRKKKLLSDNVPNG